MNETVKSISVVVPIFDEAGNIDVLYEKLRAWMGSESRITEVIFIDDASTDGSAEMLDRLAAKDQRVKVIHFGMNQGQTAALQAGFDVAKGEVMVPMDGDLQNDPEDIQLLMEKIEQGYDVVSGWRKDRKDPLVNRVFPSKVANWIISRISGVALHDLGCSLKAYRRGVMKEIQLYGEMHRFIPILASWSGARICEVPVSHHERLKGKSKYGTGRRTVKVILDLIVLSFRAKYAQRPMHIFGGFGLLCILAAIGVLLLMFYYKYALAVSFINTPLPLLSVVFFIMGFNSILMGLIAELLMRTYFESQHKRPYVVDRTFNIVEDK